MNNILLLYRDAYAGLPRPAWLLALAELINRCGFMVLFFLNIILTEKLGFSLSRAGHVLSAFGLGAIAGGYFGGWLCDRTGVYMVQTLSLTLSGVSLLLAAHVNSYWGLLFLIFFYGLTSSALFPANDTALSMFCRGELRSKGFALRRLASNLGITFGPVIGGYLMLLNYRWLFWADGLTSMAAAAWLRVSMREQLRIRPERPESERPSPSPWKDGPFLLFLVIFLLLMVAFSQLFCTFPLYLHQIYRFPESRIGGMLAVNTVAIVLFEMVLLHALRKRPALLLIGFGSLLIGLGFGMLPLGRGFIFAAFTVLIWTLGEILVIPMTATATANRAGLGGAGRYMGMLSMTFSLANFFAPMAGNGIYKALGGDTLWLIVGATGMMSAIGFYSQRGRFSTLPMAGRR